MVASPQLGREKGEHDADEREEGKGQGKPPGGADPGHGEGIDAFGRKHQKKDQEKRGPGWDGVCGECDGTDRDPDGGECATQRPKQFADQGLSAMVDTANGQKVQWQTASEQVVKAAQGDQETGDRENGAGKGVHGFLWVQSSIGRVGSSDVMLRAVAREEVKSPNG